MNINGKELHDRQSIANGFCNFFTNIAHILRQKAFPLKNCIWSYLEQNFTSKTTFKFKDVSVAEISRHVKT